MSGSSYSDRVRELMDSLLSLVDLDFYSVTGVLSGGRLLVTALREGARNVYAYTPGGELVRLNREPVYSVAEPPYGAERVVIARDVSRGAEQVRLYTVRVDRPGEEEALPFEPTRVLSIVDTGEKVYVSGVTQTGLAVFEVTPGRSRIVASLPGLAALTDVKDRTGVGIQFTMQGRSNLIIVDLETGETRVRDVGGSVTTAKLGPRGTVVYAVERGDMATIEESDPWDWSPKLLQLPAADLERYRPTGVNALSFTPRGELLVVARREGRSRIFLDGRDLAAPEGMHGSAYRLGDMIVATHTSLTTPPRIVALSPGEGWRSLLEARPPERVRRALARSSFHWVESWDGSRLPVFTLESGLAPRPGPTVVLVHGGPFSEDADMWDPFASALAVAGFHVVMPNYRGSTGYGEEWRLRIIGDPCGGELRDIISARDWAERSGLASRLYIMGYSYGGYMTMCAVTRYPGKFRAGVAGASVVDWEDMYELSDAAFRQFIELVFGGDRGKWRERSPITYVDNMREPLCIVHSQNDSRTPLRPVLRFIQLATEKGKSVEAHIAPDLGHTVNTVDDLLKLVMPAVLFLFRMEQGTAGRTG